ncbi:MAG: phosphate acyltransferase PlsX [Oscillospiraceae bacterium]|nr:phosphate acyltransferase PlsX [Oscillospiraceae bacterium]
MNIIVDAFGGDNAPLAVIQGAAKAVKELGVEVTLAGNEKKIRSEAEKNKISLEKISIIHTESVIDIHEEPTEVIKGKKDCSMAVGLQALADGKGDAFVCAGSTGALVVGSTFIAKRLKGIKRPALAPLLPTANGYTMLMDAGANVDCRPEMLVQFGIMGSCYMEKVMGVKSPKVGLINVGAEDTKGRDMDIEAYKQLQNAPLNFYGNLEARNLPDGECQVAVTDGFTGNVTLKLYEGMAKFFSHELKNILLDGVASKIAAVLIMPKIKNFKKKFDYKEVGGAVLMGISKPVIKAHGSSDGTAFFNAIRQAKLCVEGDFVGEISRSLEKLPKPEKKSEE